MAKQSKGAASQGVASNRAPSKIGAEPRAKAAARPKKGGLPGWATLRITKAAIVTSFVAGANELGVHGAFASTLLAVAAPVAVTGFVYEVSSMRQARLAYEAHDRVTYAARIEAEAVRNDDSEASRRTVVKVENPDMTGKLDAMLASRGVIVDTFGTDAAAVAPVYVRIIKRMLRDDDETLASLAMKKTTDTAAYRDKLAEREARLRDIHAKLVILAGA